MVLQGKRDESGIKRERGAGSPKHSRWVVLGRAGSEFGRHEDVEFGIAIHLARSLSAVEPKRILTVSDSSRHSVWKLEDWR